MIRAFVVAFGQLRHPEIFKFAVCCVAITVVVYATLFIGLGWALRATTLAQLPWVDTLLDLGVGVAAAILAWLMFPGIVTGIMAAFLDRVAATIERAFYPDVGAARDVPLTESLGHSGRLLLYTVVLNVLCLPLYVVLLFLPPLNLLLFYGVNGQLLGREYFETVAVRHADGPAVAALRRANRRMIWGTGAMTTALLTVPFLNLVAPIVGVAAMVHVFHKLTARM
jgi:uncharacterized protein involved in cysteine biosynthesis